MNGIGYHHYPPRYKKQKQGNHMKLNSCFTPTPRAAAFALCLALAWTVAGPSAQAAQATKERPAPTQATGQHWQDLSAGVAESMSAKSISASPTSQGVTAGIKPRR